MRAINHYAHEQECLTSRLHVKIIAARAEDTDFRPAVEECGFNVASIGQLPGTDSDPARKGIGKQAKAQADESSARLIRVSPHSSSQLAW